MDKDAIKAEFRLVAIEYLLNDLCVKFYRAIGASEDMILTAHENCRANMNAQTFPGADPATGDLMTAEFEAAVLRLLAAQRQMMGIST